MGGAAEAADPRRVQRGVVPALRHQLGVMAELDEAALVDDADQIRSLRGGQAVRDDGPQSHLSKAGTPTMGGAMILMAMAISTLLWGGSEQSLRMAGAGRHTRLRRHRLGR